MTCLIRSQNRQRKSEYAYVTVFFTAAIAIIMSLVITMLYELRDSASRMKTVCSVDTGLTSVFGEYNRQLWEQYGLIFVDSSYLSDSYGMSLSEDHLKSFINKSFDEIRLGLSGGKDLLKLNCTNVETTGVCLATDNNAAALKHQAVNLMKYHYKIAYIDKALDWINTIEAHGLSGGASYEEAHNAAGELNSEYGVDYSGWLPSDTGGNSPSEDLIAPWSLLNRVAYSGNISTTGVDLSSYAGMRSLNQGNLKYEYKTGAEEFFYLREYSMLKCGNYINPKSNSVLSYQTEYLVSGKHSDPDNLLSVVRRIMVIREAANIMTLYSDSARMGEIRGFCEGICTLLGIPAASELLAAIVVACWANYESITDVKILLKGGRIPLIKDSGQWITGLESALFGAGNAEDYNEGLSYEDYLRIFLYLTGENKLTQRLLNTIEMDVRKTAGNDHFRLDNCFDAWETRITIISKYGSEYTAVRKRQIIE